MSCYLLCQKNKTKTWVVISLVSYPIVKICFRKKYEKILLTVREKKGNQSRLLTLTYPRLHACLLIPLAYHASPCMPLDSIGMPHSFPNTICHCLLLLSSPWIQAVLAHCDWDEKQDPWTPSSQSSGHDHEFVRKTESQTAYEGTHDCFSILSRQQDRKSVV